MRRRDPARNATRAQAFEAEVSSIPARPAIHLLLIRHASTADLGRRLTGRAPGVPLSPQGEREAAALARALARAGLAAVHASPRERARATAEVVARTAGAPLAIADALDEIDFGDWTGAGFAELAGRPDWDRWNAARATARCPGGEGMAEAVDRIAAHADALAAEGAAEGAGGRADGPVALVTHCDLIRGLVARALGMSLDDILRLEVAPASVTRVEWGARPRLLTLNECHATTAGA